MKIIFPILLTLTLFSLWAGFALLVVNPLFHEDLPGYVIGRICIWEEVAIILSAALAKLMIHRWGNVELREINGAKTLTLHPAFGWYFSLYFLVALITGIWQFWLFSLKF